MPCQPTSARRYYNYVLIIARVAFVVYSRIIDICPGSALQSGFSSQKEYNFCRTAFDGPRVSQLYRMTITTRDLNDFTRVFSACAVTTSYNIWPYACHARGMRRLMFSAPITGICLIFCHAAHSFAISQASIVHWDKSWIFYLFVIIKTQTRNCNAYYSDLYN